MAQTLKDASAKGSHGADPELAQRVAAIIQDIERRGAEAVRQYSADFDGWSRSRFSSPLKRSSALWTGSIPRFSTTSGSPRRR